MAKTNNLIRRIDRAIKELESIRRELLDQDDAKSPRAAQKKLAARICLFCGDRISDSARVVRGCHHKCYRAATRQMTEDGLSESDMIRNGLLAPSQPSGRKRKR